MTLASDQRSVETRTRADDEAEIRVLLAAMAEAVRAGDVDALMVHCAPELTSFDLVPPLRHQGPQAIARIWANTLAELKRPIDFDQHYLELFVGDEVAFARSINHFGGTKRDGETTSCWLCSTLGLQRISGRWKLIHQHVSVPFDMDSGKALLALEP